MAECRCIEFLQLPQTWPDVESRFTAEAVIRSTLEQIAYNAATWMAVHCCRGCGRTWASEYPLSEQQGGGPKLFYVIDLSDPAEWLAHASSLADPLRRDYGDRRWFETLPPEIGPERCRESGCSRLRTNPGLFCRCHHFEMVMHRPCPFWDRAAAG